MADKVDQSSIDRSIGAPQANPGPNDKVRQMQNQCLKAERERADLEKSIQDKDRELQNVKKILEETKKKLQETQEQTKQLLQNEDSCKKKYGYLETRALQDPDKFYDCVIDIPSLKSIAQGWEIALKEPQRYEELKAKQGIIVSVVGNYSKGKTFLFELLSKHESPHGFNVHTKGISTIYLSDKDNHTPIIGLDTKGGSNPLDISSLIAENLNDEENALKVKEIFRDHQATEDIIQNFILEEANVIIILVADLTFDDQRLVNKIRRKFEKANRKKRIIVVHNLYHTQHVEDVKLKIDDFILKSFNLEEKKYVFGIEGKNKTYFEDLTSKDFITPHVILAKQYSEAGDYYNETTVKFIESCIQSCGNHKSIDVIQSLRDFLVRNLGSYVMAESGSLDHNVEIIDENNKKGQMVQKILFRGEPKMKPVSMDELGFLRTLQGSFEPNYIMSVVKNDAGQNMKLILRIECPGKVTNLKFSVKSDTQEFYIEVKGMREEETCQAEKEVINNTNKGAFYVKTESLLRKDYNIVGSKAEKRIQDGYITFIWSITEFSEWDDA